MPAEFDRRQGRRRNQGFKAKPWWLEVDYATELVSAKEVAKAVGEIRQRLGQRPSKTNDQSAKV